MKKLLIQLLAFVLLAPLSGQHYLLSDEFSDAATLAYWHDLSYAEWQRRPLLESAAIHADGGGELVLMPYASTWFGHQRGPLLYKPVAGDFVMTVEVTVTGRNGGGLPLPSTAFQMAGIMIRDPGGTHSGRENYAILAIGQGDPLFCRQAPGPHLETRHTKAGETTLKLSPIGGQTAVLRLARIGDAVILLYQLPGQRFVVHERYDFPHASLPPVVQAGLACYAETRGSGAAPGMPSDLRASYRFARFEEAIVPAHLNGRNLADARQTGDYELLSFLGYPSAPLPLGAIEGPYFSIWQPGQGHQHLLFGQNWGSPAAVQQHLSGYGRQVLDIDLYQHEGEWRYNAIFEERRGGVALHQENSWAAFAKRMQSMREKGYCLADVEAHSAGSHLYYTGLWQLGRADQLLDEALSWEKLATRAAELQARGYSLVGIKPVAPGRRLGLGKTRFLCLWQDAAPDATFYRTADWEDFLRHHYQQSATGRGLLSLDTYFEQSRRWFVGLWRADAASRFLLTHDSWPAFHQAWVRLQRQGVGVARVGRW